MGVFSTVLACILGFIIILNEILRKKQSTPIDIFTGVNLLFFLSFVIPPISIYFLDLEISAWARIVNLESKSSLIATFYAILGYLTVLIGYTFTRKSSLVKRLPSDFGDNERKIERFAHVIGLIGLMFLTVFIFSTGGFESFFTNNTRYRSGLIEVSPLAFIRNLALFIPISCQIFYCLYKFYDKRIFNKYHLLFILYFIASIMLYFNRATRMGLLVFIISFFLINALYYRKKITKYIPIIGVIFLSFLFYGKRFYNYFVLEDFQFGDIDVSVDIFVNQFSFPFYTLTNAIENSFFNDAPRLFFDFILGILNLFPSAILPFNIPENVTQLNSNLFSNGVPVDLISLGYYSFGISGIIIITFLFGMLIGMIEKILINKNNILVVVFYTQLVFFVSLRVPYAGPTNVLKGNICLLVAFILFIYVFEKKSKNKAVVMQRD